MVIPLCFNILQTIDIDNTHFRMLMGNVNLASFSTSLMRIFPILLVILLVLKYFDVYAKTLSMFGITQSLDANSEDFKSAAMDGKALVLDELAKDSSNSYKK